MLSDALWCGPSQRVSDYNNDSRASGRCSELRSRFSSISNFRLPDAARQFAAFKPSDPTSRRVRENRVRIRIRSWHCSAARVWQFDRERKHRSRKILASFAPLGPALSGSFFCAHVMERLLLAATRSGAIIDTAERSAAKHGIAQRTKKPRRANSPGSLFFRRSVDPETSCSKEQQREHKEHKLEPGQEHRQPTLEPSW